MALVWDFVRKPFHPDLAPGHVEGCSAAASRRPPKSSTARYWVENPPRYLKPHRHSVPATRTAGGLFLCILEMPFIEVKGSRQSAGRSEVKYGAAVSVVTQGISIKMIRCSFISAMHRPPSAAAADESEAQQQASGMR